MPLYTLARFEVRPEARADAERAMHEFATHVRATMPDWSWTTYRDPAAPTHYISMIRAERPTADGTDAFTAAMSAFLAGAIELTECELVTSSDLQRRHRGR